MQGEITDLLDGKKVNFRFGSALDDSIEISKGDIILHISGQALSRILGSVIKQAALNELEDLDPLTFIPQPSNRRK